MKKIKLFAMAGALCACILFSTKNEPIKGVAVEDSIISETLSVDSCSDELNEDSNVISISSENDDRKEDNENWLKFVCDTLVATWDKIQVWLPVVLTSNLAIIWQILKSINNIIFTKKDKIANKIEFQKLEESLENERKVNIIFYDSINSIVATLNNLSKTIFNEQIKNEISKTISEIENTISKMTNDVSELAENKETIENEIVNSDKPSGDNYGTI